MNQDDFKSNPALWFCQEVLGSCAVSLRLVAESSALQEKLAAMNGKGDKMRVLKLQEHETPLVERLKSAVKRNEQGFAVYYLPSVFKSGYEETVKECLSYRALVIDLDGAPIDPVYNFDIPATAIVETSPGKYQVIWTFKEEVSCNNVTTDEFKETLCALTLIFDGDTNACKATQPFRMPGFKHWKKEPPYTSNITWVNSTGEHYNYNDIKEAIARKRSVVSSRINNRKVARGGQGMVELGTGVSVVEDIKVDLEALQLGEVTINEGERHDTLTRLAVRLRHEGKTGEEIWEIFKGVITRNFREPERFISGDRRHEVDAIIRYSGEYFEKSKREQEKTERRSECSNGNEESGTAPGGVGSLGSPHHNGAENLRNKYSETGMIDRAIAKYHADLFKVGEVCYCFDNKALIWRSQRAEECGEVKERVLAVISEAVMEPEFAKVICPEGTKKNGCAKLMHSATAALLKAGAVASMCRGVMNNAQLAERKMAQFDMVSPVLYCGNGVIDMHEPVIAVRQAQAPDYLLNRTSVRWLCIEEACPGWMQFLKEVFAENEEPEVMINFMAEVFGYSLSGEIGEQKIFCHWGTGANGKSKVLGALQAIMGDYCTIIGPGELMTRKNSFEVPFERVGCKIEGKRAAICDDCDVKAVWNESFVKNLTAPAIRARAEYERSRVAPNRCKFHLGMNEAPEPETENKGLLRRLCIIPYQRTFKDDGAKEKELNSMIEAELGGIFAWAVRGFKRYEERGRLEYPEETVAAVVSYQKEHFKIENFVLEIFAKPEVESKENLVPLSALKEDLRDFLREKGEGEVAVSPEKLGSILKQQLGLCSAKVWDNGKKNAVKGYFVKRLFKRPNAKSFI